MFKVCFRSTRVTEQHTFSMPPSILAFTFIYSFFFGGNRLFWGLDQVRFTLGSTHVVEQLSFSLFLSISTFDFYSILGLFGALMGYYWGWGRVQTLFWGLLMKLNNFIFLYYLSFWHLIFTWFWGYFWLFGDLTGYYWGWGRVQTLFWGLLM